MHISTWNGWPGALQAAFSGVIRPLNPQGSLEEQERALCSLQGLAAPLAALKAGDAAEMAGTRLSGIEVP